MLFSYFAVVSTTENDEVSSAKNLALTDKPPASSFIDIRNGSGPNRTLRNFWVSCFPKSYDCP